MSAVLTVIPARLASVRFPRKVLAKLDGRTMVEWCWRAATEARLGPVLVAVDAPEVKEEVERFGGTAVMTAPELPSGSDRVWAAAKGRPEPYILNYQGDMPLLDPETLKAAARVLEEGAEMSTVVIPLDDEERAKDPNVVKAARSADGHCLYFSRALIPHARDGKPKPRWEHLGVYGFRRATLERFVSLPPSPLELSESLEQLRALEAGVRIRAAVVKERPVSVDTPDDLRRAETMLRRGNT